MVIRIVHLSDWHGRFEDNAWTKSYVPWANLYLVTGDMLKNYMKYDSMYCEINDIEWVDPVRETHYQAKDVRRFKFRKYLGNPDGEVVVVGGNHDFVHLKNLFKGGPVHEIESPSQIIDACGLRIGGFRGVSAIEGDWMDEMTDEELEEQVSKLSFELDILLTHAPPHGVMDKIGAFGKGPSVGIKALTSYHNKQAYESGPLRLHCFGHIHQHFGHITTGNAVDGTTMTFSNAATGFQEYIWKDGIVTRVGGQKNIFERPSEGYGER